jgi:hypothetical protein
VPLGGEPDDETLVCFGARRKTVSIFHIYDNLTIIDKLEAESLLHEKIEPTSSMEEAFPSSDSAITHALVVDDDVAVSDPAPDAFR